MSDENITTARYGAQHAVIVNANDLPTMVLTNQFTAAGPTTPVPIPSGVSEAILRTFIYGNPTAAVVVVEGSNDGVSWTPLPSPPNYGGGNAFTLVRLNCMALTGGTSPSIVAAATVLA